MTDNEEWWWVEYDDTQGLNRTMESRRIPTKEAALIQACDLLLQGHIVKSVWSSLNSAKPYMEAAAIKSWCRAHRNFSG